MHNLLDLGELTVLLSRNLFSRIGAGVLVGGGLVQVILSRRGLAFPRILW